jgi:hypothetical protein
MRHLLTVAILLFASVCNAQWIKAPALYKAGTGIIADVQSHLDNPGTYTDSDRVTTVHETTHGVNAYLRNKHGCPAFYVLKNRAMLLKEPNTTLAAIAQQIPMSLRGDVYQTYLIGMQGYWNNQPTYVFDEWVAYTNGMAARLELGIEDRRETARFALEFLVYSAYVPQDKWTKVFYKWQTERMMKLYRKSGIQQDAYLKALRSSPDAKELRQRLRTMYTPQWTKKILGF